MEVLANFVDFAQAQEADRLLLLGDFSLRPYTAQHLNDLLAQGTPEGIQQRSLSPVRKFAEYSSF